MSFAARWRAWRDITLTYRTQREGAGIGVLTDFVYAAAVIEADLLYVEGGKVQARARETLWYAPKLSQVVKVLREGRTPDEGSTRIVAELVELR